jgi:hypothetical protein
MKHAGENSAKPITTDRNIHLAEIDLPIAFDRANAENKAMLCAEVNITIAEELRPRGSTRGTILESESPTAASIGPSVGDQSRVASR